jgi:hypothetical protein
MSAAKRRRPFVSDHSISKMWKLAMLAAHVLVPFEIRRYGWPGEVRGNGALPYGPGCRASLFGAENSRIQFGFPLAS